MKTLKIAMLAGAIALSSTGVGLAQGMKTTSAVEFARQAEALKPGQWVWAPSISPQGPVTVFVDLSRQLATVYRNGVRIGVSTTSTGKPGHETPTGVFTILQKDPKHRSSKYNNAPMPYQERLTWDGVALHAGGLPGYPESHGCVHLPLEFSRLLFGITDMGGTVVIAGKAGASVRIPAAGVMAPIAVGGTDIEVKPLEEKEAYRWQPEKSPTGPVSMIISTSDQRILVMRNGVEIGRARVHVPADDDSTHVLTLVQSDGGKAHWIYSDVPGHAGEAGTELDASALADLKMPKAFRDEVRRLLTPGVTVLITRARVGAKTTGQKLTVIANNTAASTQQKN
jgi:hypothetical protein